MTEKSQKFFKKLLTSKVVYDIINSGQVLFIFEYHKNTRNPVCVHTHTQGDRKDTAISERLLRASLVCCIKFSYYSTFKYILQELSDELAISGSSVILV